MHNLNLSFFQSVVIILLLSPGGTFAGGGAGVVPSPEGEPEVFKRGVPRLELLPKDHAPGSPSIVGELVVQVTEDGRALNAGVTGRCGPSQENVGETENFGIQDIPVPYTVEEFTTATSKEVAEVLNGYFLKPPSFPPAMNGCLDPEGIVPQFAVYPHRIVEKNKSFLKAEVILLNYVPVRGK